MILRPKKILLKFRRPQLAPPMTNIDNVPIPNDSIVPVINSPEKESAETLSAPEVLTKENLIKATRVALVVLGIAVIPGGGIVAAVAGTAVLINRLRASKKNLRSVN